MQFSVLGSGSKGNSVYIASGQTAILVDAGFSGKQLSCRLNHIGRSIDEIAGALLTHEHSDHINGAGVVSRSCKIPLFANPGTFRGGEGRLGRIFKKNEFTTGERFTFQDLEIRSFRTVHDASDPVGYVVSDGTCSVGYCTDTGKVTHLMVARLRECDALILEFNHDPYMLKTGPYPPALQQRVRSSHGHLANEDAADFLKKLLNERLQYIILAHLSEANNLPELALAAVSKKHFKSVAEIIIANQNRPLPVMHLKKVE